MANEIRPGVVDIAPMDDWFAANAPAGGDASGDIAALYQQRLGRPPTAQEMASEVENAGKYGLAQLDSNLQERAQSHGGGGQTLGSFGGASSGVQSIQPFTKPFVAPTMDEALNDPGYQFGLNQQLATQQRGSAAAGTAWNPRTATAMGDYANNSAQQQYSKVYDRRLGEFSQDYNIFRNNETDRFGSQSANRSFDRGVLESDRGFARQLDRDYVGDQFNLSDQGLRAAGMSSAAGTNYANAGTDLYTGVGNSQAAGQVARGNAQAGIYTGIQNGLTLGQWLLQNQRAA